MASGHGITVDGGGGDSSRYSFNNGKSYHTPASSPATNINKSSIGSQETKEIRDNFTKLDVSSKTLLYEAIQVFIQSETRFI